MSTTSVIAGRSPGARGARNSRAGRPSTSAQRIDARVRYRRRDGSTFQLEQRITVDALICPTTGRLSSGSCSGSVRAIRGPGSTRRTTRKPRDRAAELIEISPRRQSEISRARRRGARSETEPGIVTHRRCEGAIREAASRRCLHRGLRVPAVGDDPCHDRLGVGTCRHDRGPLDDGAAGGMSSRQASEKRSNPVVVHAHQGSPRPRLGLCRTGNGSRVGR